MQKILNPAQYAKPAKALVTLNGYCINYHGKVFFTDHNFNYQPWCRTIEKQVPVPTNEYGRLKKSGLKEIILSPRQDALAFKIADLLEQNPLYGLNQKVPARKLKDRKKSTSKNLRSLTFGDHPAFQKLSQQLRLA